MQCGTTTSRGERHEPAPPKVADRTDRFAPRIREACYRELLTLLKEGGDSHDLQRRLTDYAAAISRQDDTHAEAERAATLVLVDLLRQGWDVFLDGSSIWVSSLSGRPRASESAEEVKNRLRDTLHAFREVQLADPAVNSFLRAMEKSRPYRGERVSVLDVVDDGHEIATALAEACRLPPSSRTSALDAIVRPIIQVASSEAHCEHTGLVLSDIWRYFRHTWSLEYRPTPGRSLAFLVRNAARPKAPVMGIASIANAPLQLRVRDDWVGWSTSAVVTSLSESPEEWPARRAALMRALADARTELRDDDLMEDVGSATGEDAEQRLRAFADAARGQRRRILLERSNRKRRGEVVESLRTLPHRDGKIDWRAASEQSLFVSKRADTLADLLFATRMVEKLPDDAGRVLQSMRENKDVRRAVALAVREIRKLGLSSRLLDVNVCGAVPPYRELLVGKLVALSMASREISEAYRQRYREQVSEIASQLAGRPVSRSPDVCVLTTTSLYGVSASQYNRLKVTVAGPNGELKVEWRDLGFTEGWGTTHFSEATMDALRAVSVRATGGRNVNNVFGEGQSPRLRQAREGLSRLGLDPDVYLKHRHTRRVYALELADGARRALYLNEPAHNHRPTFESIAAAWQSRWLSRRILNPKVRARVAEQGAETVRKELTPSKNVRTSEFGRLIPAQPAEHRAQWGGFMTQEEKRDPRLIQSLYRALGACADHHSEDIVALLHISTPVDDFIRKMAPGRVLFVTGNPGDGKTHLLRRLACELEDARVEVCLDANERPNEALIEAIRSTERSPGRGLAIAINEGVLVQVLRSARNDSWVTDVRRQLLSPLVYRDSVERHDDARYVVVDLNLRNNLSSRIVDAALKRLLAIFEPCRACPGASRCSLQANVTRLRRGEIALRLERLLDAVASVGVHATMRDLQGFLAFLMTGEKNCDDDETRSVVPYWVNAFEGAEGPLFDSVRRFDPTRVTHPLLDDILWRRADSTSSWVLPWPRTIDSASALASRVEGFLEVKRRAIFEHEEGLSLVRSADQVDNELRDLLEGGTGATRRCVRLINRFFDRDEERSEILYLWMTHRYDADVPRYAAAVLPVPVSQLELIVPRLRPTLQTAFPDYRPDHAILVAKNMRCQDGLRIDRALLESLLAAEQGLPSNFRRGEPEARIASFISKLAKLCGDPSHHDQVPVWLVHRDTGNNVEVTVDIRGRRYVRSGP